MEDGSRWSCLHHNVPQPCENATIVGEAAASSGISVGTMMGYEEGEREDRFDSTSGPTRSLQVRLPTPEEPCQNCGKRGHTHHFAGHQRAVKVLRGQTLRKSLKELTNWLWEIPTRGWEAETYSPHLQRLVLGVV
eukprot:GHVN01000294.1.p1 GENE.GHVN01000294.1~~GHVN01000294.1.p1  ORF type:complete len:135 (+),score=8.11 GHVN01000294.1:324-728(+)